MKKLTFIIIIILKLFLSESSAIELSGFVENTVFTENIRTVKMYRNGWKMSNPIITLNSDEQLVLSFDDLDDEKKDYYYTIYHCDRNWNISNLSQQEYINSFVDFPINDFEYSVNTKVRYINYMVTIPNEELPILYSGNYVIVVYDRDKPEVPLLTKRFYIVEPIVNIEARIRRATHDSNKGENQEIDFTIKHGNFPIQDPVSDVKVVINQNNRTDNAINNLKPLFISQGTLDYDFDFENTFKGENEFRAFEIRNIKYTGEGVERLSFYPPIYHATLFANQIRTQKNYTFYKEMNGKYHIEAMNRKYPEVEADYMFVHFTLSSNQPLLGGGVYVFGELSDWKCSKSNEMKWNFEKNQYELSLLLKQGYYNYAYAYMDKTSKKIKIDNLEGSHYETENDYQIFVYYGKITDRYDRLIGYQKFNSLLNRNY